MISFHQKGSAGDGIVVRVIVGLDAEISAGSDVATAGNVADSFIELVETDKAVVSLGSVKLLDSDESTVALNIVLVDDIVAVSALGFVV